MLFRRFFVGVALYGTTLLACETAAQACLNGVKHDMRRVIQRIALAEEELSAGRTAQAIQILEGTQGLEEGLEEAGSKQQLRLDQLLAIARFRAGGTGERQDAITLFRRWLGEKGENPWLKTRLAEALGRAADGMKEAGEILERLAKRDLIVDAEGFAALARIRKAAGNAAGAATALDRCKAMTKVEGVCTDAPLPPLKETKGRL